jgi:NAD(P)-dependent dehydrogenase (short-subunit alcohol dehydrogenase family)
VRLINRQTDLNMLLNEKIAVVYGAGGGVGSAIARKFALEGARVYLTARRLESIKALADEISESGGRVRASEVDALDEKAIESHLDSILDEVGRVDISCNAVGVPARIVAEKGMQGVPLTDIPLESFTLPIATYTRTNLLTGRAAVRRMIQKETQGVILMHTPEPARMGLPFLGGMAPAWAAMEALCRSFSAEFASRGIRAVCLRTTGMPETKTIEIVFGIHAKMMGVDWEQVRSLMESTTHARRSSTLEELTNVAAFLASDMAKGMTGTVANLTLGKAAD